MSIKVGGQEMRDIATMVDKSLHEDKDRLKGENGFVLLTFDPGGGMTNYISNSERKSMIEALKEFISRNEGPQFPTPEEN
jgi:hypothetical protein